MDSLQIKICSQLADCFILMSIGRWPFRSIRHELTGALRRRRPHGIILGSQFPDSNNLVYSQPREWCVRPMFGTGSATRRPSASESEGLDKVGLRLC